ncbi:hypothetical protein KIPB_007828, partial [Kipferlia bialata]|eukprot:g7828.t1
MTSIPLLLLCLVCTVCPVLGKLGDTEPNPFTGSVNDQ